MEHTRIVEVTEAKTDYLEAINGLLEQLSAGKVLTQEELLQIVASSHSHLFFIYVEEEIAGMLSVGAYRTPTGLKQWVEDVVVDSKFRGQHLGKQLIDFAIDYARKSGEGLLMLTSNPRRVAANKLYRSVGFEPKETNVYKMILP